MINYNGDYNNAKDMRIGQEEVSESTNQLTNLFFRVFRKLNIQIIQLNVFFGFKFSWMLIIGDHCYGENLTTSRDMLRWTHLQIKYLQILIATIQIHRTRNFNPHSSFFFSFFFVLYCREKESGGNYNAPKK